MDSHFKLSSLRKKKKLKTRRVQKIINRLTEVVKRHKTILGIVYK